LSSFSLSASTSAFCAFARATAAAILACLSASTPLVCLLVKPVAALRASISAISAWIDVLIFVTFLGAVLLTVFCAFARSIAAAMAACLSFILL
jgi:hypothetical protein